MKSLVGFLFILHFVGWVCLMGGIVWAINVFWATHPYFSLIGVGIVLEMICQWVAGLYED